MARKNMMAMAINLIIEMVMIWYCSEQFKLVTAGNGREWMRAHATFYGEVHGTSTDMGGACGYENMYEGGYGESSTALSGALFGQGEACGSCYELLCDANSVPQWCLPDRKRIKVTATNLCPPYGAGWCNQPNHHFDLSMPAYLTIARYKAGIVPVFYRRVPCLREGGLRFSMKGNAYFNVVVISNVGGSGDVKGVWVNADGFGADNWQGLHRNWGANWLYTIGNLQGKALSFRVTIGDGQTLTLYNVVPPNWRFGQTFFSNLQFQ
eukprot:PITA_26616